MSDQFNIDAEQTVLGALLRDNDAFDRIPQLGPAHFYRGDHRAIFAGMQALFGKGHRFDVISLASHLGDQVDDCMHYLHQIEQATPSAATIERHAELVYEKSVKRALGALGLEMEAWSQSRDESAACIDMAASRLDALAQRKSAKEPQRMDATLEAYLTVLQQRMDGKVKPIPTGFDHIDEQLDGGLERGTLTVLAGRPGTGKTAAGLSLCRNVARDGVALFLSMEMSETQVNDRNISALARVPMKWLRRPTEGAVDTARWEAINRAVILSRELNLFVDDQTGLSLTDIRAKARKVRRLHGLDMLCIDQLSFLTGARSEKLHEAMGEYTRGLIAIAKELDCAVVLLAQLNRDCEKRADHRPIMSDLGVSGYIEQDAANIVFLYREVLWNPECEDKDVCEWIWAKTRQGAPGTVGMRYVADQTRFETLPYRWHRKAGPPLRAVSSRGGFT